MEKRGITTPITTIKQGEIKKETNTDIDDLANQVKKRLEEKKGTKGTH